MMPFWSLSGGANHDKEMDVDCMSPTVMSTGEVLGAEKRQVRIHLSKVIVTLLKINTHHQNLSVLLSQQSG